MNSARSKGETNSCGAVWAGRMTALKLHFDCSDPRADDNCVGAQTVR